MKKMLMSIILILWIMLLAVLGIAAVGYEMPFVMFLILCFASLLSLILGMSGYLMEEK